MGRFENRTVLVTGADGGLGRACVTRLLTEGASVVLADLAFVEDQHTKVLRDARRALFCTCDVTDRASVDDAVAAARDRFGPVDALVTFAGTARFADILDVTDADLAFQFDLNVRGTLLCVQAVAPCMLERQYGRIVTVSSMLGGTTGPGRAAYGASKGAVQSLTRHMAMEFGKSGITVNSLAPGPVRTPLWERENGTDAAVEEQFLRNIPTRHFGTADDIAGAAAFLASDDAAYVNGHTLIVDGGISVKGLSLS